MRSYNSWRNLNVIFSFQHWQISNIFWNVSYRRGIYQLWTNWGTDFIVWVSYNICVVGQNSRTVFFYHNHRRNTWLVILLYHHWGNSTVIQSFYLQRTDWWTEFIVRVSYNIRVVGQIFRVVFFSNNHRRNTRLVILSNNHCRNSTVISLFNLHRTDWWTVFIVRVSYNICFMGQNGRLVIFFNDHWRNTTMI